MKISNLISRQAVDLLPLLRDVLHSSSTDPAILRHPVNELIHDRVGVFGIGHVYYHVYFNFFHGAKVRSQGIKIYASEGKSIVPKDILYVVIRSGQIL